MPNKTTYYTSTQLDIAYYSLEASKLSSLKALGGEWAMGTLLAVVTLLASTNPFTIAIACMVFAGLIYGTYRTFKPSDARIKLTEMQHNRKNTDDQYNTTLHVIRKFEQKSGKKAELVKVKILTEAERQTALTKVTDKLSDSNNNDKKNKRLNKKAALKDSTYVNADNGEHS